MKVAAFFALVAAVIKGSSAATRELPTYANFLIAGLSGMTAWTFIHPGDVIKTRLQLDSGDKRGKSLSVTQVARKMVKEEGASSLYNGLTAALARQACYTTLRLGLYDYMSTQALILLRKRGVYSLSPLHRLGVAVASGAIASFCNCPIEVCLVRMQVDGKLPVAQRRHYKNVFDALYLIAKNEGIRAYWTGAKVTMIRAMIVSVTQIATYDQARTVLAAYLSGFNLYFVSSLLAALTFTALSMPFDTVKSRLQSGEKSAEGGNEGLLDCFVSIIRNGGAMRLWSGYLPYLVSKGVLTILLFLIKEQYTHIAEKMLA